MNKTLNEFLRSFFFRLTLRLVPYACFFFFKLPCSFSLALYCFFKVLLLSASRRVPVYNIKSIPLCQYPFLFLFFHTFCPLLARIIRFKSLIHSEFYPILPYFFLLIFVLYRTLLPIYKNLYKYGEKVFYCFLYIFFYLGQNVFSGKQFKTATYFWQQPYAVDFPPASLLYICRKLL